MALLATCLRWEWVFLSRSPGATARRIRALVHERCGVMLEAHRSALHLHTGAAARLHLTRVACGLASPLLGETEIVSQLRVARDTWLPGAESLLREVLHGVLRDQSAVRRRSGLRPIRGSWAEATLQALRAHVPDLKSSRVVLIGCGRLARAVAPLLAAHGTEVIAVSHRPPDRWWKDSGVAVRPISALPQVVESARALILTSPDPAVRRQVIEWAAADPELLVLDLAERSAGDCARATRHLDIDAIARTSLTGRDAARIAAAERLALEHVRRSCRPDSPPEISHGTLRDLPPGAAVGVSPEDLSPLKALRADLHARTLSGSTSERLARLDAGEVDALILPSADLIRLGLEERMSQVFSADEFPAGPGQGALALIARREDRSLIEALDPMNLGGAGQQP